MRKQVSDYAEKILKSWKKDPGTVLDIGSMDVNGTLRPIFEKEGWKYVGVDMAPGKNVDEVVDSEALSSAFPADHFDCIVSAEMIEHANDPIRCVDEMVKILKPGGLLILTAAGNGFPEHRHPVDCWRPLPDGMKFMLKDLENVEVESFSLLAPPGILASGWKPEAKPEEVKPDISHRHVDLVMPCWNNLYYTKQAVESFLTRTDPKATPYHLILVDNGSTDGTAEYLKEIHDTHPSTIKIITNEKNTGWVVAVNQGVAAMCDYSNYFVCVNNDVLFTQDGWLLGLVKGIENKEWLAGAGPVANAVSGRQNIIYNSPKNANEESSYIIGFCMLLKRSIVETLVKKDGFFMDEIFSPGGCDEIDVCMRVFDEGYRFLVDRSVYLHHFCSKSLSKITDNLDDFHQEKVKILVKKHGPQKVAGFMTPSVQKTLIGVPSYGTVHYKFMMTLLTLEKPEGVTVDTIARSLPDIARNKLAAQAMDSGFDYLFYLDDDMIFNQSNLLLKFLDIMNKNPDIDVIAPRAFMRMAPYYPCVFTKSAEPPYYHLVHEKNKGLLDVDAITCAATLVRVSLFRKLEEKLGHRRFFDWLVQGKERMGEDISFCYRAKDLCGARIVCDSDEVIWHISDPLLVSEVTYEKYHSASAVKEMLKF